jgi:pimeloyl-ACP methyl ester carboxylesterase
MDSDAIRPFKISIPQSDLDDLHHRLASTRWPDRETVSDWSQGAPLSALQDLCHHWQHTYSWSRCETLLNSYPQYHTTIDGLNIHFLHITSPHATALPLLLTHGWPGSILEFRHVIAPLTQPEKEEEAFHLIIPSLPGYGFSSKPTTPGWGIKRIAAAWKILMERLGYEHWVAQGGDWGADITAYLAHDPPPSLAGIHLNSLFFMPSKELRPNQTPTAEEAKAFEKHNHFETHETGYFKLQATRPQTLGYGLSDSPVACAAWLYEKLHAWSSSPLPKDEVLDNIMLYWLTNSITSSTRLYWEDVDATDLKIDIPVGVSVPEGDLTYAPRSWGERYYGDIVWWNEVGGGHFLAWEEPGCFVGEVRGCFEGLRGKFEAE